MIDRATLLCFLDGTDAGIAAAVDWLQERGATLADVLLLYAGQPPDWLAPTHQEDEALRLMLAWWCGATEPLRDAYDDGRQDRRFEVVQACGLGDWEAIDLARARRAQKRAVLALFPEVTARIARLVPVPRPGAETHLFGVKPDVTFRLGLDGAAVADIDVPAPRWIPPEPRQVTPGDHMHYTLHQY